GAWLGGLYSAAGATLGGAIAFLLARYLLAPTLAGRWRGGRWDTLRAELARNDWKVVAFTRLSPVFPTAALNYCYGATTIPFTTFLWSTLLFLLPGSVAFAALGSLAGQVVLAGANRRLAQAGLGVAAAATALVLLRWALRRRVGRLGEEASAAGSDAEGSL
ncbi:MAG TPA: VTT domain-containing protein, partial [Thermoanaerobaculia bacterium]|nr:VTT domain-containing protein [Thermoanaerobaculia bacterium]